MKHRQRLYLLWQVLSLPVLKSLNNGELCFKEISIMEGVIGMKLFRSKKDVDLVNENRFLRLENMKLKQQLKMMQDDIDVLRLKLLEYQINRELKGGEK